MAGKPPWSASSYFDPATYLPIDVITEKLQEISDERKNMILNSIDEFDTTFDPELRQLMVDVCELTIRQMDQLDEQVQTLRLRAKTFQDRCYEHMREEKDQLEQIARDNDTRKVPTKTQEKSSEASMQVAVPKTRTSMATKKTTEPKNVTSEPQRPPPPAQKRATISATEAFKPQAAPKHAGSDHTHGQLSSQRAFISTDVDLLILRNKEGKIAKYVMVNGLKTDTKYMHPYLVLGDDWQNLPSSQSDCLVLTDSKTNEGILRRVWKNLRGWKLNLIKLHHEEEPHLVEQWDEGHQICQWFENPGLDTDITANPDSAANSLEYTIYKRTDMKPERTIIRSRLVLVVIAKDGNSYYDGLTMEPVKATEKDIAMLFNDLEMIVLAQILQRFRSSGPKNTHGLTNPAKKRSPVRLLRSTFG
ncbi:hypothetical protein AB5N19_02954 [Seiridium cardinale]